MPNSSSPSNGTLPTSSPDVARADLEAFRVQFGMIIGTTMVALLKVNDSFGTNTMRAAILDSLNNLNRKFEELSRAVGQDQVPLEAAPGGPERPA